uniref:HEXIM P-TEFb complex subunit 1 n=1 Tax=Sphenodon punctatus TaxID=8508 RepID=A0A8D0L7Q2_SPHPU
MDECQQQPDSKTPHQCAGGGEAFPEPPPTSAELLQENSRWQPREARRGQQQQDDSPEEEEGNHACPGTEHAPSLPARACQDLGSPEEAEGANGSSQWAAGDGQKPNQQCQGYGEPPVGEEEEWRREQRQLGKKKHRRRPSKKKRHWKPYYKLSWEEKKKFDEKQSQRASRLRAEMFAKGQPVAPYNTTQFLMEDHDQEEPDLKTGLYPKKVATKSDDTSEEDFMEEEDGGSDGMGGDGSEFLQRDFSETYERYHVESLQNMSKQELIKEYLELEKCLSRMEDENNRLRLESKKYGGDSAEDSRVRELELELDRLRAENQQLLKENELQRRQEKALSKFGE